MAFVYNFIPGIELKVDHGSQNTAQPSLEETRWLGYELAFTYVGNPEGNAIVERVIGTI